MRSRDINERLLSPTSMREKSLSQGSKCWERKGRIGECRQSREGAGELVSI